MAKLIFSAITSLDGYVEDDAGEADEAVGEWAERGLVADVPVAELLVIGPSSG